MTEIFRSTRKLQDVRDVSASAALRPPLGGSTDRVNGTGGQRTEDDPDFYPLWVIYGGHCPGGYVLARVFPGSVHPRSATSRLGSYRRPSEQVRAR
jgi:hypothetical protein